ncbi:MAG: FtsQ-type POTRA domain-containing protein [Acidobacteria bacterium]|nr:MAG: FtsQ-type POTRA domain-containing protein [Acidobacteriota bacterium]
MRRPPALEPQNPGGRNPFRRPPNHHLRRSRRRKFMRQGGWSLGFMILALGLIAWVGVAGWRWMHTTPLFAIDHILVEGFNRGDPDDLQARLAFWLGSNLVAADLEIVRQQALAAPWVQDASVRRILPNTLAVRLTEKEPAAMTVLAGHLHLVDRDGRLIVPWDPGLTGVDLPLLTGLDALDMAARPEQARAGLKVMAQLMQYNMELMNELSEIDLSRGDRVTIRLNSEPAPLYLSRENVIINLDHYLAIRDDIHSRVAAVQAIDLRWRGRVVVIPESEQIAGNRHNDG